MGTYLEALEKSQILIILKDYDPFVAGTLPLGISIPGSDIDLICSANDLGDFELKLEKAFGSNPNYKSYVTEVRGQNSFVATFTFHGFVFEVFAQNMPTREQHAVLHFQIEKKLLEIGGEQARKAIQDLKLQGLKTEPAFAQYFNIQGDPYDELAKLARLTDEELKSHFS